MAGGSVSGRALANPNQNTLGWCNGIHHPKHQNHNYKTILHVANSLTPRIGRTQKHYKTGHLELFNYLGTQKG